VSVGLSGTLLIQLFLTPSVIKLHWGGPINILLRLRIWREPSSLFKRRKPFSLYTHTGWSSWEL